MLFYEVFFYWFLCCHAILDAMQDGYTFDMLYGDQIIWGVTERNWHSVKTGSRLSLVFTGIMLGMLPWDLLLLLKIICGCLIAWILWRMFYHKTRYDKFIFTEAWANKNAILIPLIQRDFTISLQGNEVVVFYCCTIGIGLSGILCLHL